MQHLWHYRNPRSFAARACSDTFKQWHQTAMCASAPGLPSLTCQQTPCGTFQHRRSELSTTGSHTVNLGGRDSAEKAPGRAQGWTSGGPPKAGRARVHRPAQALRKDSGSTVWLWRKDKRLPARSGRAPGAQCERTSSFAGSGGFWGAKMMPMAPVAD